jgi:hypothetical protein
MVVTRVIWKIPLSLATDDEVVKAAHCGGQDTSRGEDNVLPSSCDL